jgi:hypothetical protein
VQGRRRGECPQFYLQESSSDEETTLKLAVGREEGSWTELVEGAELLVCPPEQTPPLQGRKGRRSSRRVSKWVLRTQGGSRTLAPTVSNYQEQLRKGRECTRVLLTSLLRTSFEIEG